MEFFTIRASPAVALKGFMLMLLFTMILSMELKVFLKKYILDDPLKKDTNLGPVVRLSAAQSIRAQIIDAISSGAKDIISKENFKIDEENNCYVKSFDIG